MTRQRTTIRFLAVVAVVALAKGCGDSTIAPPDPPLPTTVVVTPASAELTALGATVQFSAEVLDHNGQTMAGVTVAWASDNTLVAVVDGSGLATAAGDGTAAVAATAGSASGTATLTVAQVVRAVVVSPGVDTLVAFGDTIRLSAEATDANGHAVIGAEFMWASSDTAVARVGDDGLVEAVAEGEAVVTATASGVTGGAEVMVVAPLPATMAIQPDTVQLSALGDTAQLMAEVRDQIGRAVVDVAVSWASADTTIARVDSVGLVVAVGTGTTMIAAAAGEVSGTAAVAVMQSAASVVVSPSAVRIASGDTLRLVAEAFDANGHLVTDAAFTWSSSSVSVARVDATGLVRGMGEGGATITAVAGDARGTSEITVENPDRAVLVALYEATNGRNWVNNDGWLTDAPLPQWYGVRVNHQGRVEGLRLRANRLEGSIPPQLGRLGRLQFLEMCHNSLTGPIPPTLGNLEELEWLILGCGTSDSNHLSGEIPPELGELRNLRDLSLTGNNLTGPIPPQLLDLVQLERLSLHANALTGEIPPGLGRLTRLRYLDLARNRLAGSIPSELGELAELRTLWLGPNALSGGIPPEIGNLVNLNSLYLTGNQLTGPIPSELGALSNLTSFSISGNGLTGSIPTGFLRVTELRYFSISGNAGLCVPGIPTFLQWAAGIGSFSGPYCHEGDAEVLRALYDGTGGPSWSVSDGWLDEGPLGNWTGVTTDSIGLVQSLDLDRNGLEGRLPARLGALSAMTSLRIGGNRLAGPLPRSLARLRLQELRYEGTDLCVPVESAFRTWLRQVTIHEGTGVDCAPLADRDILATLYEATGGPRWRVSRGWLTDAPIGDWHGVAADDNGRVIQLELRFNDLAGVIPGDLGYLTNLEVLDLSGNSLTGRIPPELGDLASLQRLRLSWNGHKGRAGLEGEIPSELGNLVSLTELDLFLNSLTGSIPPELGKLRNLRVLKLPSNDLTGGIPGELGRITTLVNLDLGNNSLAGPIPTELAALPYLETLRLGNMSLSGPIPPELGALSSLRILILGANDLEGTIPRQLGQLTNLEELWLSGSNLTGPIPSELGNLANLNTLALYWNELAGPVPEELGNLSRLQRLYLYHNQLTGDIPAEIGGLESLVTLALNENRLSGPIPAELGNVSTLILLDLADNNLAGAVPQTFGGLRELRTLRLSNNEELSGPIPRSLTNLAFLGSFQTSGTELCAPPDPGFLSWLDGVQSQRVRRCASAEGQVYLTQAVQSTDFPVPLVANEPALLRVFVTSEGADGATIPPVRAMFYDGGVRTHMVDIPAGSSPIPAEVVERDLTASANAEIVGAVLRPGVEMVVEIDPEGTLDPALGIRKRIPETGRTRLDVRSVPVLDLTVVPFLWRTSPDSAILDITADLSDESDLFRGTRTLLPVEGLDVTVHPPVWTSTNNVFELHDETRAIRAIEGGNGHYVGTISGSTVGGAAGVTTIGGRASFAVPESWVIAHELGHNMGLAHAPCGNPAALDRSFPQSNGSIGAWGYDFRTDEMVYPGTFDLMSYCRPRWISDYHFTNALRYRLREEDQRGAAVAAPARSLLLWGGIDAEGAPYLEPAFVIDAPAALPNSPGEYQLAGRTGSGGQLFSISFAMPEMPDGDGRSAFAFVLPARSGWEQSLASITLSGPGGTVTLDDDSDRAMAILRDSRTGRVRGILRGLPEPARTAADAEAGRITAPALETLFSRGIPDPSAWWR